MKEQESAMPRAPFQVLILPFRRTSDWEYAIFRRKDLDFWQGLAGGGKVGEKPEETAKREAKEEASLPLETEMVKLDTVSYLPIVAIKDFRKTFDIATGCPSVGPDTLVIPEYCFGADATGLTLVLSHEHTEMRWCGLEEARNLVRFDSNKTALWELSIRLARRSITGPVI
jgi:dihydroneopterin triphosphate diphosphatase